MKNLRVELFPVAPKNLQQNPHVEWELGTKTPATSKFRPICPCPDCIIANLFALLEKAPLRYGQGVDLTIDIDDDSRPPEQPFWHRQQHEPRPKPIQFTLPMEALPELLMVRRLYIKMPDDLLVMPGSACRIASRLTGLRVFGFSGTLPEWADDARKIRDGLYCPNFHTLES